MQIELDDAHAARLTRLARDAQLSRARWVRAAVVAADEDPELAERIVQSAPPSRHGGARPGAGRPPQSPKAAVPPTPDAGR